MDNNDVFECQGCGFAVSTELVARYSSDPVPLAHQIVVDESEINTEQDEYVLRCCPKCKSPFLIKYSILHHWEAGSVVQEELFLYPSNAGEILTLGSIPTQISRIYSQAKNCFSKGLFEPSVIMARKCLEAICKDLNASGGNLAARVESLSKANKIDARLYRWATELRLIGNDAAHELDLKITKKDAEDSLAFLNAMLLYIYTLEKKFAAFLKRRGKV